MRHLSLLVIVLIAPLFAQEEPKPADVLTLSSYVTAAELTPKTYDLEKLRPFKTPIDSSWKKKTSPNSYWYRASENSKGNIGPQVNYNPQFPDLPLIEWYNGQEASISGSQRIGPEWTYYETPVNGHAVPQRIVVFGDLTPPEAATSPRVVAAVSEPQTLWLEFNETGGLVSAVENTIDDPKQTVTSLIYDKGLFYSKEINDYSACLRKVVRVTWKRNPASPATVKDSTVAKVEVEYVSLAEGLWEAEQRQARVGPVQPLNKINFLPNGDLISIESNYGSMVYRWRWAFPTGEGIPALAAPYKQDRILKRTVVLVNPVDLTQGLTEAFTIDPKTGLKHGWYIRWNPAPENKRQQVTYQENGLYLDGKRQGYWKLNNGERTVRYIDDQIQERKE